MSEPVSNAQVEDVLASIRRLVSEDKKPARPVSQLAESEAFDAPENIDHDCEKQDKLVLTPSLRVAEAADQDEEVAETPSPDLEEGPQDTEEQSSDDSLAEEVAEFIPPAPFQNVPDDWDEDTSSDPVTFEPPKDAPLILSAETQLPETSQDAENPEAFSVDTNNIADTFKDTLEHSAAVLDAPMEPDQTALDHADGTDENAGWREFLEDSIVEDSSENAGLTEAEVADPEPAQVTEEASPTSVEAIAESVDADVVKAATLGAKIAALEAVIGKKQDNWEPDGVNEDDYSGTSSPVLEWEDHASDISFELVETEESEPVEDISESAEDVLAFANDEDLLDEDALRDMVAEIVRQELQGALGERITRNVRKLVRREIHRALASQELE